MKSTRPPVPLTGYDPVRDGLYRTQGINLPPNPKTLKDLSRLIQVASEPPNLLERFREMELFAHRFIPKHIRDRKQRRQPGEVLQLMEAPSKYPSPTIRSAKECLLLLQQARYWLGKGDVHGDNIARAMDAAYELATAWNRFLVEASDLPATVRARIKGETGLAEGRRAANKKRQAKADRAALKGFRAWQHRARAALSPQDCLLDARVRLRKYILATQPTARVKSRLKRLLGSGQIPDLEK